MCNTVKLRLAHLPKSRIFIGCDADVNISVPIQFLPTRFSPQAPLTYIYIYIYICHTSHILWKNLQAYNIEGTVQQEKEHKFQGASRALGIV